MNIRENGASFLNNIRRRLTLNRRTINVNNKTNQLATQNVTKGRICGICGKSDVECKCSPRRKHDTKSWKEEGDDESEEENDSEKSYSVIDGLGMGGFATVVKVIEINSSDKAETSSNNSSNEYYAMKVISKSKIKKDHHRQQILSEVKIMKKLKNPFLIRCYDNFESNNSIFLVLDFVGGGDLFYHLNLRNKERKSYSDHYRTNQYNMKLITRSISNGNGEIGNGGSGGGGTSMDSENDDFVVGFEEYEARFILAELYLAIEHLHINGYIHRDIKIENVMLDVNGHVKLIDYGFAVELKSFKSRNYFGGTSIETSMETSVESFKDFEKYVQPLHTNGSLVCLSPELLSEKTGGRHTDWWAYGVLAYELLTGCSPWSNITDKKIISNEIQHLNINYPEYLNREAKQFLMLLLTREYQNRLCFENDEEMKDVLFFKNNPHCINNPSINWKRLSNLQISPPYIPGTVSALNSQEKRACLLAYNNLVSE